MNFHNRQYDPQIGRFLGVDPLAAATGNMSSYAGMNNNPANVVDPLGLMGEMITQDILVENGEDWRLAYNVYKGPSPGREDDIDERTGTGMYAVMLRYAEFMMEVEKQREAGGMTIDQMVDEAKNNPDKTVYFEKGRLVYVSSGIMLEDLEVRDGRADYAGWGKRMDKRFGQSLGWDFGGYGQQSNGGSGWLDYVQTGLDFVGLIPGLGEIADGANALIYLGRGDYVNASLSAAAMIPIAGWAATGGKFANKAVKYSNTKKALGEVHDILGGPLPKGTPGKFGSPQRGDAIKGYRLDPAHPGRPLGHPESVPHINYWDYTNGKRGKGGISGAIPIINP
jgi:hypothetical protein